MQDINNWQEKFELCTFADRLLTKLVSMNNEVNFPIDINEVKKAIYYAKKYHGEQKRQSDEPYYSHPITVAYYTSDHLFRTDIIVTAILHDTIEDTSLTKEMIAKIFGNKVAGQVDDLTRMKPHGKISSAEMLKTLYKEGKHDILLIKVMDRLHNMQTIGAKSPDKVKKIVDETTAHFLTSVAYLFHDRTESTLYQLCLNSIASEKTGISPTKLALLDCRSHLAFLNS